MSATACPDCMKVCVANASHADLCKRKHRLIVTLLYIKDVAYVLASSTSNPDLNPLQNMGKPGALLAFPPTDAKRRRLLRTQHRSLHMHD